MPETLAGASVDVGGAVTDALRSVAVFVPKALLFVAILVVGWLVARLLRTAVDKILERVGFDRLVERGGIKTALARSRYDASDIVAKLVYYAVLLFTLQLAFGIWGPNAVSTLIAAVIAWLPKAFVAILIVVVASAIAAAVKDVISNALGGLSYGRTLANIASVFIIGIGVIAALNQIGVATTVTTPILIAVLATVAGILIVGVGGGLIKPMQARWDGWLNKAAEESARVAEHAKAYSAGRSDADQLLTPAAQPVAQPAPAAAYPATNPAVNPAGYEAGHGAHAAAPATYAPGTYPPPEQQRTQIVPPTDGQYRS
ncbi:hypothetical protein [Dactylosporangium sp. NPDC000521]|uniref:mechanosensitive ion channel family protein n=1 Tax=Dactylosporangium sp. NPDC000521 TaxID=3363975 RepID=UPI0036BD660A